MTMSRESVGTAEPGPDAASPAIKAIEGRSLSRIAWSRLKKDKLAMTGGVVVILLILIAVFAPFIYGLEGAGTNPDTTYTTLINPNLQVPYGSFGGVSAHHWLGIDLPTGRDMFARILVGARVSLGTAVTATVIAICIGVVLGMVAGYFGGWVDSLISRTMDILLAFPLLLFAISLSGVLGNHAFGLSGNTLSFALLVFIIGFFSWPYIGRIVRGQTIALREREFVEAARSLGAGSFRIIFREILPNLTAPILVYSTLLIPANILFEAALSFLGVGYHDPLPSWGSMINLAINYYQIDPMFLMVPGLAIFITVLAFNLLGDGLRDAFDPKAAR